MLLFNTLPIWLNVFLLGLCVLDNDPLYLVVMLNNDELACLILFVSQDSLYSLLLMNFDIQEVL